MSALPRAAAPELVVRSRALQRVLDDATRAAPTGCHVLILGERGVGKEGMARHLHARSGRRGELVTVNCAAIPASLAESTLFGHARGAFTGAGASASGLVRAAEGGTLFLDEVGELPPDVQARLLRLLQEGVVQPVGERERRVDVRIVAATNRDLDELVAAGRFRADLRDRLHGVALRVPPLRERRAEIVPLAEHFLATAPELAGRTRPTLSAGAAAVLKAHAWPGNVRELRNAVVRAAILGRGGLLTARQLRASIAEGPARGGSAGTGPPTPALLEPGRAYAMAELVALLGLPRGTARRRVAAWVEAGALSLLGAGRRRRYGRVEAGNELGLVTDAPSGLQRAILAWLAAHGPGSTGALALALGAPLSSLKRAARGLLEQGRLRTVGAGRATRLVLAAGRGAAEAETASTTGQKSSSSASTRPGGSPALQGGAGARTDAGALALQLASEASGVTARRLAEALGQTVRSAERLLARLVERGLLRPEGHARSRRYTLPTRAPCERSPVERPPSRPATPAPAPAGLTLHGEPVSPDSLRVALLLAASPAGVSAITLAREAGLPEPEAACLLRGLARAGLLNALAEGADRWSLFPATPTGGGRG